MKRLIQIPAFADNYIYVAVGHDGQAFVVDPAEAAPVLAWLKKNPEVSLKAVVNTHHHFDHVGGNEELKATLGVQVVGAAHDADRITGITQEVSPGQTVEVAGMEMSVLDVKAHTRAHIAYRTHGRFDEVIRHGHEGEAHAIEKLGGRPALFVGDAIFLGGCGRLFEGSAEDLALSMQMLAKQPPDALVCCAHEYTQSNLRFAAHIFPKDTAIAERLAGLEAEMASSGSSVPGILRQEFSTNPFMLGLSPPIAAAYAQRHELPNSEPATVLGAMRAQKDSF